MPAKKKTATPAADAAAAPPAEEPSPPAASKAVRGESLDDFAMLLLQLEPVDESGLAQLRDS